MELIQSLAMFRISQILMIVLFVGGCAVAQQAAPADVPASLKPTGNVRLVLQTHAIGSQIYECTVSADGKYAWTLKGPDAELRDGRGSVVISHSAGPKWQHRDGSVITGSAIAKEPSPDGKSIPWLLLSADNSTSHEGTLSKVTFVQRIHTEGGQAPTAGCEQGHKGAEFGAKYQADYLFYAPQ